MEGKLLSGEAAGEGHVALLRVETVRGRTEQHVLSDATATDGGKLEDAGARGFSILSEGFAAYYALQTIEGR